MEPNDQPPPPEPQEEDYLTDFENQTEDLQERHAFLKAKYATLSAAAAELTYKAAKRTAPEVRRENEATLAKLQRRLAILTTVIDGLTTIIREQNRMQAPLNLPVQPTETAHLHRPDHRSRERDQHRSRERDQQERDYRPHGRDHHEQDYRPQERDHYERYEGDYLEHRDRERRPPRPRDREAAKPDKLERAPTITNHESSTSLSSKLDRIFRQIDNLYEPGSYILYLKRCVADDAPELRPLTYFLNNKFNDRATEKDMVAQIVSAYQACLLIKGTYYSIDGDFPSFEAEILRFAKRVGMPPASDDCLQIVRNSLSPTLREHTDLSCPTLESLFTALRAAHTARPPGFSTHSVPRQPAPAARESVDAYTRRRADRPPTAGTASSTDTRKTPITDRDWLKAITEATKQPARPIHWPTYIETCTNCGRIGHLAGNQTCHNIKSNQPSSYRNSFETSPYWRFRDNPQEWLDTRAERKKAAKRTPGTGSDPDDER
jgi:hypothetical protein